MSLIKITPDFVDCYKAIETQIYNFFDRVVTESFDPNTETVTVRVSKDSWNLLWDDDTQLDIVVLSEPSSMIHSNVTIKTLRLVSVNGISVDGLNHGDRRAGPTTSNDIGFRYNKKSKG